MVCTGSHQLCKSLVDKLVICFLCPWCVEKRAVNLICRQKDSERGYEDEFSQGRGRALQKFRDV